MKKECFGLILASLLLVAALGCLMSGCMTYQKAVRKFGHLAKDSATVIVNDTVITRKDSVLFGTRTDTTVIHEVFRQGRAKLTFDRNPKQTTVKAECQPDTIIRTIRVNCPPVASFGIAPWYKTAFYITLGVLIAFVLYFVFSYLFKLSMIKR